jgi:hypothetical protein
MGEHAADPQVNTLRVVSDLAAVAGRYGVYAMTAAQRQRH